MVSVNAFMNKTVEQTDDMSIVSGLPIPSRVLMMLLNLLQNLNFIECCFHVVRATFLNLNGNVGIVLEILAEPDSGKMAPAKFLNNDVPV